MALWSAPWAAGVAAARSGAGKAGPAQDVAGIAELAVDASDTIVGAEDLTDQLILGDRFVLGEEIGNNADIDPAANDVDIFKVTLQAFQRIVVDVLGLGDLDGQIRIFDAATGEELAFSDDAIGFDPLVDFVAPADGVYSIAVSAFANSLYDPTVEGSGADGESTGAYELSVTDYGIVDSSYIAAVLTDVPTAYAALGLDASLEIANVSGFGAIDSVTIDLGESFADAVVDSEAPFVFQLADFRGLALGEVLASADGQFLDLFFAPGSFEVGDRLTVLFGVEGELPGDGVGFAVRREDGVAGETLFEGTPDFAIATLRLGPPPIEVPLPELVTT